MTVGPVAYYPISALAASTRSKLCIVTRSEREREATSVCPLGYFHGITRPNTSVVGIELSPERRTRGPRAYPQAEEQRTIRWSFPCRLRHCLEPNGPRFGDPDGLNTRPGTTRGGVVAMPEPLPTLIVPCSHGWTRATPRVVPPSVSFAALRSCPPSA